MIVSLGGENTYAANAVLKQLRDDFIINNGEFGVEKFNAAEAAAAKIIDAVQSLPFLASRRMVIVQNPAASKDLNENVDQLLDAVADTTDLIFTETKYDKRSVLYKTLKKRTDFREFGPLDERGLAAWLVNEAKARGGQMANTDAIYLVNRAGLDQLGLSGELDKLLAYSPEISKASIDLLVEPLPRGSIFELLDAAFAGNQAKALMLYESQRQQQVEPQAIMGLIAWQLHALAVVKFNEGPGLENAAMQGGLSPFVARKTLGLAKRLSQKQVKDLVRRALELDVALKSEAIDADDAVRAFLLTI